MVQRWLQSCGFAEPAMSWFASARTYKTPIAGAVSGVMEVGPDAVPAVADLNGDGLKDLVCGQEDGTVVMLANSGTAAAPRYTSAAALYSEVDVDVDVRSRTA